MAAFQGSSVNSPGDILSIPGAFLGFSGLILSWNVTGLMVDAFVSIACGWNITEQFDV